MKRIKQFTFLTAICFFFSIEIVLSKTIDIETAEARVKAIVAYELNALSLKDNDDATEFNSNQKELETADSIDIILFVIQDFKKNVKFTNEIKSINGKLTTKEELLHFYTEDIYKIDGIKEFLDRHANEADKVKSSINKAINEYLNSIDIPTAAVSDNVESDSVTTPTEESSSEGMKVSEQSTTGNTKNNFIQQDLVSLIAKLASVIFAVTAIVLFFKVRKLQAEKQEMLNTVEENKRFIMNLEAESKKAAKEIERKNREIRTLNENIERLEISLASAREKAESLSQQEDSFRAMNATTTPKEYYVGSPRNGFFAGGSEEYRPGKSLFRITISNGNIGEFEFVQRPEAIQIAQQSKSTFLEPACIISNDVTSFSHINTIKPGRVERTDDGWMIVSKADISLT